jgi:cytochrome c-type biogenesis protein CcmE
MTTTEARSPALDVGAGMPSLDEELPPIGDLRVGPRRRRGLGTRKQKVVAGAVIVSAIGFLLYRGLTNATEYYLTTTQAVAQKAQLAGKDFRIQGTVLADPGVHQVGHVVDFTIAGAGVSVPIVSSNEPPQLFKVGLPVVLDGHWAGTYFASDRIMVQHGSTYTEAKSTTQATDSPPARSTPAPSGPAVGAGS